MSKFRIYELAKEFNTTSKVIIDILDRNSVSAKNHMSCVDDDAKAIINRTFAHKNTEPEKGKTQISPRQSSSNQQQERQLPNQQNQANRSQFDQQRSFNSQASRPLQSNQTSQN
ncbi:MAG: translation initiation factor IF-2 N-terminal domain-containing protein, partial [Negativicutes bacterium]|nr:translation initiation factor IF-2 N-terminal domain-containing protein [Negativicutes bacterium]